MICCNVPRKLYNPVNIVFVPHLRGHAKEYAKIAWRFISMKTISILKTMLLYLDKRVNLI